MKRTLHLIILSIFVLCGSARAQAFRYDIQVDKFTQTSGMLSVDAFVRVGGESHTKIRILTPADSKIGQMFLSKHLTGDLEYSRFKVQTKIEIPGAPPRRTLPNLDIVTKEVMEDLSLNAEYLRTVSERREREGSLIPFPLNGESILVMSEITQNEYLGIQPKIVFP